MQKLMLVLLLLTAEAAMAKPVAELWADYGRAVKSSEKLRRLQQVAAVYEGQEKEARLYDSVVAIAVETARMSGEQGLMMDAYRLYYNRPAYTDPPEALEYAADALGMAERAHNNEWLYLANRWYTQAYLATNDNTAALERITKAYYYAGLTNNDTAKVQCFLLWGKCLERTNNKLDAFRNYLNALNVAQKHKMRDAVYECYSNISFFYLLIANYERAKEYKIKQMALAMEEQPVDSAGLMNLESDLSIIYYYNNERRNAERITERLIVYARAHGDSALFEKALFNQRVYLAENGLFEEMAEVYTVRYPAELEKLKAGDQVSYYRLVAYINEVKGDRAAALQNYRETEQMIQEQRAGQYLYLSNFMKRYAQFLLRAGDRAGAMVKMEAAYENAKKADYLPYLVETTDYLDTMNYASGNMTAAYTYSKLNKEYRARQEAATKQDALLLLEIDNETKQREIAAMQEAAETEHRHNLQYLGIVVAIIFSFIVLMFLGSFKVPAIFIKSLGFFSFIFFFEFIILLADHKIMEVTHHEPWKMLAIKILIISFLLPFHHWIEHRVIHYLTAHKLIDRSKLSFKRLWGKA